MSYAPIRRKYGELEAFGAVAPHGRVSQYGCECGTAKADALTQTDWINFND